MKLLALDIDGTVIRSFMREGGERADYDTVEVLPGRVEKLRAMRLEGVDIVLVTNQGGVAHGYQTVGQVGAKISRVWDALFGDDLLWSRDCIRVGPLRRDLVDWRGLPFGGIRRPRAYVSFGLPDARLPWFREDSAWRKPGPGMLIAAMTDHLLPTASGVLYVGDMASDREAAEAAGIGYMDAADFFRDNGDG